MEWWGEIKSSLLTGELRGNKEELSSLISFMIDRRRIGKRPLYIEQGLNPKDIERAYGFATTLYDRGSYLEAQALLSFLSGLDHYHFGIAFGLGLCSYKVGEEVLALAHLQYAAKLSPLDPRPPYFTGEILESLSLKKEAYISYDLDYKLSFGSPEASLYHQMSKDGLKKVEGA